MAIVGATCGSGSGSMASAGRATAVGVNAMTDPKGWPNDGFPKFIASCDAVAAISFAGHASTSDRKQ
ncbi:hypothetical protein [Burkholderia sp. ABCPW 11]|uniref:hypothetical protein n=1 Tax=Burkholderia sp. ABCPW 11 TaxID=1637859 RepID=UPI0012FDEDF6|nr:hypothetical protein [Burkholderia sp. ABCPW 11]